MNRVECKGLRKFYGAKPALRDVSLAAPPGCIVALIGANGAGKTTLLEVLATLLRPDAGEFLLDGEDALKRPILARRKIGFLGHASMLDPALTARENLRLFGALYGLDEPSRRADELVDRFGMKVWADSPTSELSRGQQQTAGLCRALVHSPPLLLLDEPASGLDSDARARLWAAAQDESAAGATVIFSTHDHDAASLHGSQIIRLHAGEIVQDGEGR